MSELKKKTIILKKNSTKDLLKNRIFQIKTITELAEEIANISSINSIYKLVVNLTKERFGYYHVNFYRLEEDLLITQEATGKEGMAMKKEPRTIALNAEKSLVAKAAREKKSIIVENVDKSDVWLYNPYLPNTKAEIAVPLKIKGKIIGVLDVQSNKINGLNKEDVQLLLGICGQVAVAIDYEKTKAELNKHQNNLKKLVIERTAKLSNTNKQLKKEIEQRIETEIKLKQEIKQRTKTETKLKKAKHLAEESLKIKQEFVANINHELRTPLTNVIGMSNLLDNTIVSTIQHRYIDIIKNSASNLIVIINDILNFSQLESNKITIVKESLNIFHFLEESTAALKLNAKEKGLDFYLNIDKSIPTHILFDKVRLNQIILNLVHNAIKFTLKGRVELEVCLVSQNDQEISLKFSIRDTGIGISKKNLSKIFLSFTQAKHNISARFGGTGLGLTISKKLIELQHGKLEVKSKLNHGSIFSFILKLEKSNNKELDIDKNNDDMSKKKLKFSGQPHILVVEDNKDIQLMLGEFLNEWGAVTFFADNGKIALEKISQNKYNLMLLDLRMPVMDGFETLNKMKELNINNIPVICLTAYTDENDINKALKVGMKEYVSKPFYPNQLFEKISKNITY